MYTEADSLTTKLPVVLPLAMQGQTCTRSHSVVFNAVHVIHFILFYFLY